MPRWIIISIALIFVLAVSRLIFTTSSNINDDVDEYVKSLDYDFIAMIDSVVVVNQKKGTGWIVLAIQSGHVNRATEDSLNRTLKHHKRLRFLIPADRNRFKIFQGGVKRYNRGDSVVIDSPIDRFSVWRNGESIRDVKITQSMVSKVSFAFWLPD